MVGYSSYLTQIAGVVSKYYGLVLSHCYTSLTDNAEESCGCLKYLDKNKNNFCLNCEFLFLTTNVPPCYYTEQRKINFVLSGLRSHQQESH